MLKKWLFWVSWTLVVAIISSVATSFSIKHAIFYSKKTVTAARQEAPPPAKLTQLTADQIAMSPLQEDEDLVEIFSYFCSYCAEAEKDIGQLKKKLPPNKRLVQLHIAGGNNSFTRYAPLFATLSIMGIEQQYRQQIYQAVGHGKIDLADSDIRNDWLQKNGIDPNEYERVSNSEQTKALLDRMAAITRHYNIRSIPIFIVNKKWIALQDRPYPAFGDFLISLSAQHEKE